MKKILLTIICGLFLSNAVLAQIEKVFDFSDVCSSGQTLYYKILDDQAKTVSVTYPYGEWKSGYNWGWDGYAKPEGNLAIPAKVTNNGIIYTVVCVRDFAFRYCDKITSVIIPNTISVIETHAFNSCSALKSVTLPNSVKEIGNFAFEHTGLKTLQLPNSLSKIGNNAFSYCLDLESVTLPSNLKETPGYLFCGCGKLKSITIPSSLKKIRGFEDCYSLQIVVPSTVTEVGYDSFRNCLNVTYYGKLKGAPWGAQGLNAYVEGNLVYKDKTKKVVVGCKRSSDVTSVIIPNTVVEIRQKAFQDMIQLKTIVIGTSVNKIGDKAFFRGRWGWDDTEIAFLSKKPPVFGKNVFVEDAKGMVNFLEKVQIGTPQSSNSDTYRQAILNALVN